MPTQIRRNLVRQLLFNGVALALVGLAVWAFFFINSSIARWVLVIGAGLSGLFAFLVGLGTSGIGACPECNTRLDAIDLKTNHAVLCPSCQRYLTSTDGMLDVTPADYVASMPAFGAALPEEEIVWPAGCCVCEGVASRLLDSKLVDDQPASTGRDFAVGVASLGVLKAIDRTTYRVAAPHCDRHKDGVSLVEPKGLDHSVAIAFRSYPYYQKFVSINRVAVRELL
jgi:hypothetical protein